MRPKKPHTWVGDPSEVKSPILYGDEAWPAVLIDDESRLGYTSLGIYLYQRVLLASGTLIEVYPSFLTMCEKVE